MNLFRLSTLALAIVLAACGSDGKDGQDGQNGSNGSDGTNAPTAKALELTILHMNDHHSHLSAETLDIDTSALALNAKTEADEAISEVAVEYGGFPMLTTLFTTLSNQHTNVLKLHSGDAVTGTLYFSLFNGTADAAVMNQICFDAFALGNHEFDGGDSGLANFLDSLNASACETATLAANVQPSATSAIASGYIQPYTIVEKDGEKIGIIGIDIASKTQNSSFPDAGTLLLDETETAQQYIDELTAAGINKIILMTHYQYANDLTLASNLTGVDVIVGGDSHTLLGDSTFTKLGFNPVAAYPTVVTNKDGDTTCVVHAWEYAHLLGKLDVSFDADGVVTQCSGHPYLPIGTTFTYAYNGSEDRTLDAVDAFTVTQQLTADDDVVSTIADSNSAAILAGYDQVADVLRQTVIGTISEDLCLERIPGQGRSSICDVSDTTVHGSDISNIVAKAFMTITPTADIAIQNGGGVRVDVASGDYTIADAYSLLPFANTMATLEMTGQQIKNVLEDAFDYALSDGGSTGSYPYASGLRFDVDASQAKGSRFSNLEVNSRVAGDWGAIDLAATYIVVTNNYIAAGQDGYTTFAEITGDAYVDTFTEYAQGFMDYVKQLSDAGQTVNKLPISEYSTQSYIGTDSCNHSSGSCIGF